MFSMGDDYSGSNDVDTDDNVVGQNPVVHLHTTASDTEDAATLEAHYSSLDGEYTVVTACFHDDGSPRHPSDLYVSRDVGYRTAATLRRSIDTRAWINRCR